MKKKATKKIIQCRSRNILSLKRCQGISSHKGMHWRYTSNGWLIQWSNKAERTGYGQAWTPPTHDSYVSPTVKFPLSGRTGLSDE